MDLLSVFLLCQENVLAVLLLELIELETMLVLHLSDRVVALFHISIL